jgi:integrase/recombinase XerD
MKPTDFATHLTAFLTDYLAGQRNLSPNTIKSYRDTFVLFLRYCRDKRKWYPERIILKRIDHDLLLSFLEYLENERQSSFRTRNQRLAAFHSFFRYLQVEAPECMMQCQKILAIPFQRVARPVLQYLAPDDLAAILALPDLSTKSGKRDAVLLSLLYDSGARVQELIDLCVQDVRLEAPAYVRLTGKGRKTRLVPLMQAMVQLISGYLHEQKLLAPEFGHRALFTNRFGQKLSRSGVRYILLKYVEQARANVPDLNSPISPHSLRHTKAMHLLEAGNPLVVIRDFLGHADITTTEIYARANMDMKRKALEKAHSLSPKDASPVTPLWLKDGKLLQWLQEL